MASVSFPYPPNPTYMLRLLWKNVKLLEKIHSKEGKMEEFRGGQGRVVSGSGG